jgi:regulator of protease activity HflC (stomatin/prohibitin superfamily)
MSTADDNADLLPGAPLSRAVGLVRQLLWIYGVFLVGLALFILPAVLPIKRLAKLKGMATELLAGGLGEVALLAVLLALIALTATALLASSRLASRRAEVAAALGEFDTTPPSLFSRVWALGPGVLAREGQAIVLTVGAALICLLAWRMWPQAHTVVGADANLVAALTIGLAFPSLICERMVNAFPSAQMPEAPGLRRLLLLTTLALALGGVAEIGRGVGFGWVYWVQRAISIVFILLAAELALRGLARLFLPPPAPDTAKAVADSIIATLITGGPRAPGQLIRTHLGLDFARSWALSYLSAAAVPAIAGTLLFCWMLSGVKLLNGDQRGIYERLGAPIRVIGPGFHILAPWPIGKMRAVEYGTIHVLAVGAAQGPGAYEKDQSQVSIKAEDQPTPGMNRLWETAHSTEAEYLVANQNSAGVQNFQAVNTEILVLYRVGMTDAAAWAWTYGASDPATLVEQEADRLATHYFASHTLDGVMGGQRDQLQETLRAQLAQAVDANHAGIEIVSLLINEVHPPAGAAAAYHNVQAEEINSKARVSNATAHATSVKGKSDQEAYQATTSAQASSIEKVQAAGADSYQFDADRKAYQQAPPAFLLERRARNLTTALKGARMTIIDSRLSADQVPFIDMRTQGGAAPAAGLPPATQEQSEGFANEQLPSTSSETSQPGEEDEAAPKPKSSRAR